MKKLSFANDICVDIINNNGYCDKSQVKAIGDTIDERKTIEKWKINF